MRWGFLLGAIAFLMSACEPSVPRRDGSPDGDAGPPAMDSDGDGISDDYEGARDGVDTDGDGTPDYLDTDSDDDGIADSIEGRVDANGAPADSDSDGVPDFRDLDSDANGIQDADESEGDLDGDGIPNAADLDDDDDGITDANEIGDPSAPVDFDGDGMADYQDTDSDNDTIGDLHESVIDTDADGVIDRWDLDSDEDGWTDAEEAGDADLGTPPVDTDGDGTPDFRDADSDGDGLSDRDERTLGTARDNADTDGDGVSDLVEIAACPMGDATCANDATDPTSSPRARGDFVFAEPYMMPPMPPRDTLDFATDIRVADVYFLVDTTGSMGGAIMNVRMSLRAPGGIIDQVRAAIPDTWFGVGDFRDFGDAWLFRHVTDMTTDAAIAQSGVDTLNAGGGGDYAEGDVPALWSVATGGAVMTTPARSGCPAGTFGYACMRSSAVPIVVLITDAPFHNGPGGTNPYGAYTDYATMLAAVTAARIRVVGVAVGAGGSADLQAIARDSGAVDVGGAPLVSDATSGTVGTGIVDQIRSLANATRFDINLVYEDDMSDAVDTWAAFVDHIEANTVGDPARGCDPRAADDTDGDGFPDTFRQVPGGTRVCFDIVVKQNDTVMPTTAPQIFRATLRVLGDGFTELDSRDVYFLVPPEPPIPGGPD
ncbi:MAG: VWA domain-containing protein [Sandaracinaceae bacterium]